MRFEIIECIDNTTKCNVGNIELDNLQDSKFNEYISHIPKENQKELNDSGETSFKIEKNYICKTY